MGGSLFFFVESKSFEFSVKEGGSFFLLRIFERDRDSLRSVFMGKECAKRMLSIMEKFIFSEPPEHFARIVREGETVFILQLGSNAHGYYLTTWPTERFLGYLGRKNGPWLERFCLAFEEGLSSGESCLK